MVVLLLFVVVVVNVIVVDDNVVVVVNAVVVRFADEVLHFVTILGMCWHASCCLFISWAGFDDP